MSFLQGKHLSSATAVVREHTAISLRILLYGHFTLQNALCASAIQFPWIYALLHADPLSLLFFMKTFKKIYASCWQTALF